MNNDLKHIAIIMDGNGRWAKQKGLPRVMGHREGVKTVRRIVEAAVDYSLEVLTLYAFSIENWNRSQSEVNALMHMLPEFLNKEMATFREKQIQLKVIGRIDGLPQFVQESIWNAVEQTSQHQGLKLVLALNYGGRSEIVDAVKKIVQEHQNGELSIENINEQLVSRYLYTSDLPDPDLLIRTSGEMRISNFLLWQISYTELYVTKKPWPEFSKEDFYEAIRNFHQRERRFGGESAFAISRN